ncbi:MAG: NAD-dependent protein deacylase [Promethearchaeota archaeon]
MQDLIAEVARALKNAKYTIALTGAGISKESNVPTFRGKDGLWNNYNVMELATPQAFSRNPKLVWEWYTWRQGIVSKCNPNPAHIILAKWEREGLLRSVISQNVDGLHRRAGSENVLEVHGNLWSLKCVSCNHTDRLDSPAQGIPECPECGNNLRPDVVWFGESLPHDIMGFVYRELESADLCLVIGTSALVQPAASFPLVVKQRGGLLVEINVEATPVSPLVDYQLRGEAGILLPKVDSQMDQFD